MLIYSPSTDASKAARYCGHNDHNSQNDYANTLREIFRSVRPLLGLCRYHVLKSPKFLGE